MTNSNIVKHSYRRGQCGNPQGRPKGAVGITAYLRKLMDKRFSVPDDLQKELVGLNSKLKASEIIALRLVANAMKGKDHAIDTLLERIDGKIAPSVELHATYTVMPTIKIDGREAVFKIGQNAEK